MRQRISAAVVTLVFVATGACDQSSPPSGAERPEPTPVPAPAPPVGACYNLTVADGLELSTGAAAVPCGHRHTSVTVAVSRLKQPADGSPLPLESVSAQRRIAKSCKAKVDAHVGGSRESRRLSRVQAVWFSPSASEAETGARWYRCDLVIAGDPTNFAALPRKTRGLLNGDGARRYGTCGTAAPGATEFRRVSCSRPHTWRARASINLPAGSKYLSKKAGAGADAACRDIEAQRAVTATRLRWSFEWPTKAQWAAGQRYGLCWTPDS